MSRRNKKSKKRHSSRTASLTATANISQAANYDQESESVAVEETALDDSLSSPIVNCFAALSLPWSFRDRVKSVSLNSKSTLKCWGNTIEKAIVKIVDLCVDGDPQLLYKELESRMNKRANVQEPIKDIEAEKVLHAVVEAAVNGSTGTRNVVLPILAACTTYKQFDFILDDSGYSSQKKKQTLANKRKRWDARRLAAQKRGEEFDAPDEIEDCVDHANTEIQEWRVNRRQFRTLKTAFKEIILEGKNRKPKKQGSRVSEARMLSCLQWVTTTLHYRPGRVRNVRLNGRCLQGMPVFVRNDPIEKLFSAYREHTLVQGIRPISRAVFLNVVTALSTKGKEHAGLSYYYVDHMELIATIRSMFARVPELFAPAAGVQDAEGHQGDEDDYIPKVIIHKYFTQTIYNITLSIYIST
jgi:hypothetical protein